jgi:3-hydroxyisobutyrate dehydrogenase
MGGSGVIEALHAQTASSPYRDEPKIFIDSTTLDVDVARDVSARVIDAGAEMIDAPVSGGKLRLIYPHSFKGP